MSCTGCNDGCFDESVQLALGPAGSAGTNGTNGLYGGWSLKWKFDTNIGSGTGSNEVRLNNASPASATVIYVNDDAFGTGAADVFLSSVTSAPFGKIKIFKEYDSTIFWLATITAADDTIVPAEVKFTVTDVVTNGSFTDGDDIVLTLAPAGATGATGAGTNGTVILYQDTTIQSPTSLGTSYSDVIGASAIPITGIGNVGDQIRVEMTVIGDIVEEGDAYVNYFMQVTFGGLDVYLDEFIGRSLARDIFSGTKMIFDLVVTAANTLKVRTLYAIPIFGLRAYQYAIDMDTTASFPLHFVELSTINPTLSGSNDLKVRLKKSSAGIGTEQCSVTSMTVYRMLKEQ